jgi:transposase
MHYIGIDLHKKAIAVCVRSQEGRIVARQNLACADPEKIRQCFVSWAPFQAVMEATAAYEWLWQLLEPLADRLVLAHPKKLRVIAESTKKSDRLDAQLLAEFLARDMISEAYRPSPRQRQHRILVRQRFFLRRLSTAVKNRLRHLLAQYNADRRDLFSPEGLVYLQKLPLAEADRWVADQLRVTWEHYEKQRTALDRQLREFAKKAPAAEKEAREVVGSIPYIGPVTVDIVVSELGDVRRFRSAKRVVAYAGLAPGRRESGGKAKELGITKDGSRLLRWALVEAAWRVSRHSRRWGAVFENLAKRRGRKKAAVAVARRLLAVMASLLRSGQLYRLAT